jgi:hypothetical protein
MAANPPTSETRASFQGAKRVSFREPQSPGKAKGKAAAKKPIVLNASLPLPILRKDASETKIIVVRKGITSVVLGAKPLTSNHTFALAVGNKGR